MYKENYKIRFCPKCLKPRKVNMRGECIKCGYKLFKKTAEESL